MNQSNDQPNVDVLMYMDGDMERKDYIPSRFTNRKIVKPCIIGSVIIFTLIVITIIVTSLNKPHDTSTNEKFRSQFREGIIMLDNKRIYLLDPKTKIHTLLYETENSINAIAVYNKGIVFSSGTNISQIYYLSYEYLSRFSPSAHQNLSLLFEEPKVKPYAMAIDYITDNLYIVDKDMGGLIIFNIETKYYTLLTTKLKNPSDIVLDPAEAFIFILQNLSSICRGNMDGNQITEIVQNKDKITTITIDQKGKRIYWISNHNNIESSLYDGTKWISFLIDHIHIISLTMMDDQLFWMRPAYGSSAATLSSCKVDNTSCKNSVRETIDFLKDPKFIKSSFDANPSVLLTLESNQVSCKQLKIAKSKNKYTCACKLGWELDHDEQSCREVIDFILYVKADKFKARSLNINKTTAVDVIWPTSYDITNLKKKTAIDFDYDLINDILYFSDDRSLRQMKLKSQSNQSILIMSTDYIIEDLAYDWLTENLYYIQRSYSKDRPHLLMMFNVKLGKHYRKTLKQFIYNNDNVGIDASPYALAIYPRYNYLFFNRFENFQSDGRQRFIEKFSMNGTKLLHKYVESFIHEHRILAIDYIKDRIYRISDSDSYTKIIHSNLDISDEKRFTINSIGHPKTIYVHQEWLYISNDESIWRVNKETGVGAIKIENDANKRIMGMRVMSMSIQSTKVENNLCAIDNGQCEEFCFYGPQITCGCEDFEYVQNDGRSCL